MPARYTQDSIERLREAVDIVAEVSRHTDLRRVGSRFTGLCPFHEERTPSFSVDAERGLYHCFGCQKGGDAIRLVQELESLDFPEAVEQLAERYGVELAREREDPREEERRRLVPANDKAVPLRCNNGAKVADASGINRGPPAVSQAIAAVIASARTPPSTSIAPSCRSPRRP